MVLVYELADGGRIVKAHLIAVPLFTINSIEKVESLASLAAAASQDPNMATGQR